MGALPRELYDRARGDDERRVEPKGDPKSFSRESAFAEPVSEPEPKYDQIETLAEAVADRATREGALYRTVGVKAVLPPFEVNTREQSLPAETRSAAEATNDVMRSARHASRSSNELLLNARVQRSQ